MPWLHHPSYKVIRDHLIERLRTGSHQWTARSPIVFLCGAAGSPKRDSLALYLRRKTSALVFYAEDIWKAVQNEEAADALQMEKRLGDLADMVVVIVESAGTLAELGAFSLDQALLGKLLPIVDSRYRADKSFINSGPLQSVDQASTFAPTIHADFQRSFLLSAGEVEQRLGRIPNLEYQMGASGIESNSRHLLVPLVALVSLLFPVTEAHLRFYALRVFKPKQSFRLRELLNLSVSLGLLNVAQLHSLTDDGRFYYPAAPRILLKTAGFNYFAARAHVFGVLHRIPEAVIALEHVEKETRGRVAC